MGLKLAGTSVQSLNLDFKAKTYNNFVLISN
jgi:hypothetical protein